LGNATLRVSWTSPQTRSGLSLGQNGFDFCSDSYFFLLLLLLVNQFCFVTLGNRPLSESGYEKLIRDLTSLPCESIVMHGWEGEKRTKQ